MRTSLLKLIKDSILFQYAIPHAEKEIPIIKHSTLEDHCYKNSGHSSLVNIIYNAIIEYAFSTQELTEYEYQSLHSRALKSKLKYNEDATEDTKISYGFYGEVLLHCILKVFYQTNALIARGYFYSPLENSETKGFDSFHIIEGETPELWFGEAKFYGDYKDAMEKAIKSVMDKIEFSLSDVYLQRNLVALCEEAENFDTANTDLKEMVATWKSKPDTDLPKVLQEKNFKIIYPILILYDDRNIDYDACIKAAVSYLNDSIADKYYTLSLPSEIFFILVPLTNTKQIKKDVIECISQKKQVMS